MPEYFNIACRFNAIPIADVYSDLYIYVTFAVWDLQFGNFHIHGKFPTNMPQIVVDVRRFCQNPFWNW